MQQMLTGSNYIFVAVERDERGRNRVFLQNNRAGWESFPPLLFETEMERGMNSFNETDGTNIIS